MKFIELGLPGAWVIEPVVHADERGTFRRHFCAEEFAAHGLAHVVMQGNVSENPHRGTLRGLHYQVGDRAEAKTLSCISGALHDIVVDLRQDSPTFMKWIAVELESGDGRSLHVPVGCANGWITTAANTSVHYYMSERYSREAARGIRYNDPIFDFRWPMEPHIVSEKDRAYDDFDPGSVE